MILFSCPNCHKIAEASDALAGSIVTCPDCNLQMTVPAAPPVAAVPGPTFITSAPPVARILPAGPQDGKVRFLCPSCKKRLRAPGVAVGTITVCRRCGQRMEVPAPPGRGGQPPPVPAAGDLPQPRLRSEYYYVKDGQRCGPVSSGELKELVEAGQLAPMDLIWKRGMAQWTPAVRLKGLFPGVEPPPLPTEPPPVPGAAPRAPVTPVSVTPPPLLPMPATRGPAAPTPPARPVPPRGPAPAAAPRSPAAPPAAARPVPSRGSAPGVSASAPKTPAPAPAMPDVERSLSAWTETLRLDPRNVSVRINRSMAYAEKGDYEGAMGDLTEALRLDPRNAQAYASRGVIHAQMRADYAKGIADLTRAIQCAPDEVILYEFRAVFYRAVGDSARAAEDERKAAELRPRGTLSNLRLGPAPGAAIASAPQKRQSK